MPENSMCQGPAVGVGGMCLRSSEESSVALRTWAGEMVEKVAGEVKVGTSRMYRTSWPLEKVLNGT